MKSISEASLEMENLATGKGIFYGYPLFLQEDGSIIDCNGTQVAKPSTTGAAKYAAFAGYKPNDTVIPYQMLPFISEVDSVKSALPTLYVDGDFWVKQNAGADELFVQTANAWVAHVGTFTEAAAAPEAPAPVDGDYYYNTTSSKLFLYVTDTWVEVTTQQVVRAATAPAFYDDGYVLADQNTKKIYTKDTTWGEGVSLASGKLYTDGTDLYVFGSGSLAKI